MYGKLGRMTGRSYEDTVHTLIKGLKSAESQTRAETFIAFGKKTQYTEKYEFLVFLGDKRGIVVLEIYLYFF